MRDYAKLSPKFWLGKTGKELRGDPEAQIVALYLMTSPHSEMTGVFHCPLIYIAHETGLPFEGASKGLTRCIEVGFCTFEADTDTVFVHEMAKYQIGDDLKPTDNRVVGIQKMFASMPESVIRRGFYEKYKDTFFLPEPGKKASPFEAPSKPRTGTGTRTRNKPSAKAQEYPDDFETAWNEYPARPGASKKDAFKAWSARIKEGVTAEQMLKGVRAYAAYVAIKRTEPNYIKLPATFFGPDEHYNANWFATIDGNPVDATVPVWER